MMTPIPASEFEAIASSFDLLSQLWLVEVDQDLLRRLNEPALRESLETLGAFIPKCSDEQTIQRLAVDYCQLLVGPKGHVAPFQSVWEAGRFQSDSAISMQRFFDLIPGYNPPSPMVDHIGVQLDFVSKLLSCNAEPNRLEKVLDQFCEIHFRWTDSFLDKIDRQTDSQFYLGLSKITRQLLQNATTNV